uniref:hypothetical protein n=1 Tax=Treponema sp. TaxID=166 RepID=UPI00298DFD67
LSGHEYSITSKVSDPYGNEGAKTKDERNVIIDVQEPAVSIIEPVRLQSATAAEFSTYVLQNNSVLPKIKNGTFEISGSQREDTNLDYLVVYLDKEVSSLAAGSVTEYPVANPLVRKVITGANLRNWSTTVSDTEFTDASVLTGSHILRLVTESHDQAGNVEIKSHGWFKFDNGADTPWVTATFGYDNLAASQVVANRCYPRCSLHGQAYDDDGLKSISVKVYDETETELLADYSVSESTLVQEGYPTYRAWSFNALSETRSIVVKINVTDKNGKQGDEVKRYLTISDVNPPNLSEITPSNGNKILEAVNSAGSFNFSGKVEDDGNIAFVKIVRIKSGNDNDQISYFNKDYTEWSNVTATSPVHTDSHGNKIWWLPLGTETQNADQKYERTWSKSFNIFTDFGINGTEKLTNQKFIILAQDVGASANIEAYSLQGDIDPPQITIDKIYLNNDSKNWDLEDEPIELPEPFNRNGALQITDKIKISGTWSDNSTDLWNTDSNGRPRIGDFTLNVGNTTQSVTVNANGTWTTGYFTPVDSSVCVISASLKDWAGNEATKSKGYYVNSSTPVLTRIGADTPDGAYKNGSTITITMEFNKAVTFSGGTPVLHLNARGGAATATYDGSSNGTSKHKFTYTVESGDDVAKLNVSGIDKDGITWKDSANAVITNLTVPTTGGTSLAGGRNIVIDTTSPSLTEVSLISGSGWNKTGSSIFVQAKFSEDVTITPSDLSNLKLNFNNGAHSGSANKTGPDTVLFKYVVGTTDTDTNKLQINSITSTGYTVSDNAGNAISTLTLPNNLPEATDKVVKIDTHAPTAPTIVDLPTESTIYADSFSFSVNGAESDIKYTLDGSTWLDYTGEVTVSNNGNYSIAAKQTDAAGNVSESSTAVSKTLNTKKFISYITSEQSDGTYTTDDEIIIKLVCNEKLTVDTSKTGGLSNAYLTLNTTPERKAYYLSGSGTTELKFKYTVTDGDTCAVASGLNVLDFVSSIKNDTSTTPIDVSSRCELPAANNLSDNRTINVITGAPLIQSINVDQSGSAPVIKIKFTNDVSKQAGKFITVVQTYTKNGTVVYNAPAVLTSAQYNNFYSVDPAVETYYEKGVNGLKADKTPDLTEKYVLKFTYDGETTAVREFFKDTLVNKVDDTTRVNILTVCVPTASSKVRIDPSDKKTLLVTLSDAYKLPVKGAEYTITVPEGVVVDDQAHVNTAANNTATFTLNGEEKPVIRVDKSEASISGGVAAQPLTASVKMDCQTPEKTISYSIKTVETKTKTVGNSRFDTRIAPNTAENPVTTNGTYNKTTGLTVGSASNRTSGYKIEIDAYTSSTNHTYESAIRSVICLSDGTPSVGGQMGGFSNPGGLTTVYVRGGDSESGESSTVGFPLSWNSGRFSKAKMMTQYGTGNNSYWYYVTWNISVNCYFGFLCGNTPSDVKDNGPSNWCWASCGWVSRKHLYYLEPGTSFTMDGRNSDKFGIGGFQYQGKHLEYRTGGTATSNGKATGVLVNAAN